MAENRKTIYLVDDDISSLTLGKNILAEHYKVFTMDSGAALLEFLEKSIPDLILLDVEMPEMNGYEAIKIIKSKKETKDIPIIFLTAKTDESSELEGLSLGAIDYITKPFSPSILLKRVEIHIKSDKKVRIQTIGNFEIFIDEKPVSFTRSKTKELFAYLVSRKGALCSNNEIIAAIWKDQNDLPALQSHLRQLVADLNKTLKSLNVEDIIIKRRGHLAVALDRLVIGE